MISQEHGDFILLTDDSTTFAPDCIETLISAASAHPEAGAFGPKIYDYDDPATLWYAGAHLSKTLECTHHGHGLPDYDTNFNTITPTGHIPACALLIRKSLLEKFPLDPKFTLWNDIDLCHRLRKAGHTCLFVPKARAWHQPTTLHNTTYHYTYTRERLRFALKHKRLHFLFLTYPKELLFTTIAALITKKKEQRRLCRAALKAMLPL